MKRPAARIAALGFGWFTLGPGPRTPGPIRPAALREFQTIGPYTRKRPRVKHAPKSTPTAPPVSTPASAPAPANPPPVAPLFQAQLIAVFPDEQFLRIAGLDDLGAGRVRLRLAGGGSLEIGVDNLQEITYEEFALRPENAPVPKTESEALPPFAVPPALDPLIRAAALKHGLDWKLVVSLIKAESNFNPLALSRPGAQGLMQLMPATARLRGVAHPFDPAENLDGGCAHLKLLLARYPDDLDRALAAYNAGEGAVDRHGGVPPFRETRDYVKRIRGYLNSFKTVVSPATGAVVSPAPVKPQ